MAKSKKENNEEIQQIDFNETVSDRIKKIRGQLNKKVGFEVAFDLNEKNPTEVKDWIPTGSRWLDSVICKGKMAGIPVGKIVEIAGVESSGKSYMAMQIAKNAMLKGYTVVFFDSESAIDPEFIERIGINVEDLLYVQATSCEFVFETIEEMLSNNKKMLFILDSLANTATKTDIENDFDPLSSMAVKPRILSKMFQKLTIPLANHDSTLLIINQLKTNITSNVAERFTDPFFAPGGRAPAFLYSLRIWLTPRKAKSSFVLDDNKQVIGTEIKATIKKSRFGSFGKEVEFQILWAGDKIGILDEESWCDAIKSSEHVVSSGPWNTLMMKDGSGIKFQDGSWMEKMKDENFKNRVIEVMDELLLRQ